MVRLAYLLFGAAAYLIFFATFLYLIAFVGDLPWVPRTIDRPESAFGLGGAVATNLALVLLFGLQHSVMARRGFKEAWTRIVPEPIERSTYVLFASLALIAMFLFWQPLPSLVWSVENEAARMLLWALFCAGWLIVLVSTLLISHFELFGLKQVWSHMRGTSAEPPVFRQPFFYKMVRHPIYTGFFIAFWATPEMSIGHLLFTVAMSAYMLIAIGFEERDLIRVFGEDYEQYRTHVGKLAPRLMRRG